MLIGCVIISYNPKISLLKENIDAIIQQVDQILVVDNGSNNITDVKKLVIHHKIDLLALQSNMGIATALNEGFSYFQSANYDWVLTLDQDSVAPKKLIDKLVNIDEFDKDTVGIVAADFIDRSQGEEESTRSGVVGYSKRVITSGSLTNIKIWQIIGGYDEHLFIDYVDHDFNQRIIDMGFKIFQVNDVFLIHSLGDGMLPQKNILAKIFEKQSKGHTEHSAFRQYYIFRNGIIFNKRYSKHVIYDNLKLISDIRWVLLFSDPSKQLAFAFRGIWDGLRYNKRKDVYFQKYLMLKKRND
ncbi:glycosyltransferase family 2 protein [Leuconostoc citreum]|uniref:glycosyltransferase family 2 protein n=1 Tax=Leuconostoc citreum TaxID=33964 RepID=UPI00200A3D91|nr:glycosyltransferase family 2 protein [Leuconostoc citreum]MCK8604571.1 glycosyltransferase family 2 protein [Leuconostoc citreum]